ncbi:hypothetical protein BOTBODRAFT_35235 [Botryobasidium botryosum FD-172 SS1]|uniref:AB hydrolase-1 domain-containing protein n=1 Tax=Botryobasidium botryosum (strain FD-172 SS1) TaxID=930990 RepID=A0A067M700_BOTB1|nr:hypothetical protein BOTBODRAFT_35235 [Botryobasidium botryosum FD-172 SS1]
MAFLASFAKDAYYISAGITSFAGGLIRHGQGFLIYPSAFPVGPRDPIATPDKHGLPYEDLTLETPDGLKIRGYLMRQQVRSHSRSTTSLATSDDERDKAYSRTRPTVILFHGNAGNIGNHIPFARVFFVNMRCNVLLMSYRGYANSEGTPSEKGLRIDAQTTLDFVMSDPILKDTRVVLHGQSLGGAVAIDLASRNPDAVHGLILENTFLSIPALIPTVMPILSSFTRFCNQKWNSAEAITLIPPTTPMLFLSGLQDEVVPASHMAELFKIATQKEVKGRKLVEFPDGLHNTTCIKEGYWEAVAQFMQEV